MDATDEREDNLEDNIPMEGYNDAEEGQEESMDEPKGSAGKFDRLLGESSRKFKLSGMFKD